MSSALPIHRRIHRHGGPDPVGVDWENVGAAGAVPGWGSGRFISVSKNQGSVASASSIEIRFDTTAGVGGVGAVGVVSNDTGPGAAAATRTSPWTGDHFRFDWAADPYAIEVTKAGLYLVQYWWYTQDWVAATLPSPVFAMEMFVQGTTPPQLANYWGSPSNVIKAVMDTNSMWEIDELRLYLSETDYTWRVAFAISHNAGSSSDNSSTFAGFSIWRLGSLG